MPTSATCSPTCSSTPARWADTAADPTHLHAALATALALGLVELREHARQALGNDFDIRAFHDLLLGNGALPLAVVEGAVDEWIKSRP